MEALLRIAITKSRLLSSSTSSSLSFSSQLVFGQPATSHLYRLFRPSPSKLSHRLHRQLPKEAWKKTERRTPDCIADHGSDRGDVRVPLLDACSDVPLHRRWSLSSFSFSCTHSSPASSWAALRQWGDHHVSFAPSEFSLSRSISEYVFPFVTLVLLDCFALIWLSNLGTGFCLRRGGCDTPGFPPGY
jgi:hypothetical protein